MLSFLISGILSMLHITNYLLCNLWFTYSLCQRGLGLTFKCHKYSVYVSKKSLRIISFLPRDCFSSPLFKKYNLLEFEDKGLLENVFLASKYFNNILPSVFNNWLAVCSGIRSYNTAASSTVKLFKPSFRTKLYGKNLY